jgi:uncharacterized protein (TIGR02996 family)
MVSEDDFHAALDADPSNSAMRLVFADWLEEHGDRRAGGYRWMGQHGKWPYDWARHTAGCNYETFDWYFEDGGAVWDVPEHCRLPGRLRAAFDTRLDFPDFATRRAAEEALCLVLSKTRGRRGRRSWRVDFVGARPPRGTQAQRSAK